jgi:hypothetical protein
MPWAVDDTCCGSWSADGPDVDAFVKAHSCLTQF